MALGLYMNEHVPHSISIGLKLRDVDVLTAQEDQCRSMSDPDLLSRATVLGRIMFSFDADMLREATRRLREGEPFSGLVFAHPAQISIGECIRDLEIIAKGGSAQDVCQQVVYLPL